MPPTRNTPFNRMPVRTPAQNVQRGSIAERARPNRDIARGQVSPSSTQGEAQRQTDIFTYFTKSDGTTRQLYSGDRLWATVTLTLETAGPVSVGIRENLTPVLGGIGKLLLTGVPYVIPMSRGQRLYIASTSINRVSVQVAAVPWLEQLAGTLTGIASVVSQGASGMLKLIGR